MGHPWRLCSLAPQAAPVPWLEAVLRLGLLTARDALASNREGAHGSGGRALAGWRLGPGAALVRERVPRGPDSTSQEREGDESHQAAGLLSLEFVPEKLRLEGKKAAWRPWQEAGRKNLP